MNFRLGNAALAENISVGDMMLGEASKSAVLHVLATQHEGDGLQPRRLGPTERDGDGASEVRHDAVEKGVQKQHASMSPRP